MKEAFLSSKNFNPDIQVLRGVSLLLVLSYHLKLFKWGFIGVDIFFVISGYLMAMLCQKDNYYTFIKKRIWRLFPAFIIVLSFTLLFSSMLVHSNDFKQVLNQSLFSLFSIQNFLFWSQNTYFTNTNFNPLLHYWSLAVEVQYYIICPFFLPLFIKQNYFIKIVIILFLMVMCFVALSVSPKTAFFMTIFRLWEFLMGSLLWSLCSLPRSKYKLNNLSFMILLSFSLIIIFFCEPNSKSFLLGHPGLPAFTICLLVSILLFYNKLIPFQNFLFYKALSRVGNASYSIYLIHYPLLLLMTYTMFSHYNKSLSNIYSIILYLFILFILSFFIYKYFERIRLIKKNVILLFLLFFSFLAIALTINITLQLTLNSYERAAVAALSDRSYYRCGKISRILDPFSRFSKIVKNEDPSGIVFLIGNSHADSIKESIAKYSYSKNLDLCFYHNNNPLLNHNLTEIINDIKSQNTNQIILHYNNIYDNSKFTSKLQDFILYDWHSYGIKVHIIGPVPYFNASVPMLVFKNFCCSNYLYSKDDAIANYEVYKSFVDRFVSQQVVSYNPTPYLVDDHCILINQNEKVVYFDDNHLTLSGAMMLDPLFEKLFSSF